MKKIEINSTQFQTVLQKAIETKPLVRLGHNTNDYFVAASDAARPAYRVSFTRGNNGQMFGSCLCQGAMRGFHCYHLAAALIVHSSYVRAGLRRPAPPRRSLSDDRVWRGSDEMRSLV